MTLHGDYNTRKRCGINKRSVARMKQLALERGIRHNECSGRLLRYMNERYLKKRMANNMRIYAGHLWLFSGESLITVYPMPSKYHAAVRKCIARRKKNGS